MKYSLLQVTTFHISCRKRFYTIILKYFRKVLKVKATLGYISWFCLFQQLFENMKLHENETKQSFWNQKCYEVCQVNFGKSSLRSNNLKLWCSCHWHVRAVEFYRTLSWTTGPDKLSFIFNEPLKRYGLLYFTTFTVKPICHTFASFGPT